MSALTPQVFDTAKLRSVARMAALKHPKALVLDLECDALAAANALDEARQMLADAPHDSGCYAVENGQVVLPGWCDCWKSKL